MTKQPRIRAAAASNTLSDIPMFVTVAEVLSFAEAARLLGLTSSALGKAIARLEGELGCRLFHRTTREMSLTEAGELFLESALHVLSKLEETQQLLSSQQKEPTGLIRITIPLALGQFQIIPSLAEFSKRYPGLRFEIQLGDLIANIAAESIDVVIRIGEVSDSRMVFVPLVAQQQITCASPKYLEIYGEPQDISDLNLHHCVNLIVPSTGRLYQWCFMKHGKLIKMAIKGRFALNNAEGVYQAALAGMGIVQLPSFIIGQSIGCGQLKEVLSAYRASGSPIWIGYQKSCYILPKIRAFVDYYSAWIKAQSFI